MGAVRVFLELKSQDHESHWGCPPVTAGCRHSVHPDGMTTQQPHILFILVDEMRYPMHFPGDVRTPDMFMKEFMPHTYELLWMPGVRFGNAFTAA